MLGWGTTGGFTTLTSLIGELRKLCTATMALITVTKQPEVSKWPQVMCCNLGPNTSADVSLAFLISLNSKSLKLLGNLNQIMWPSYLMWCARFLIGDDREWSISTTWQQLGSTWLLDLLAFPLRTSTCYYFLVPARPRFQNGRRGTQMWCVNTGQSYHYIINAQLAIFKKKNRFVNWKVTDQLDAKYIHDDSP